jgi:tripeptidyl-peptidase-1
MLSPPKAVNPRAIPASCNTVVNPSCLQAFYGIPATPATQASNSLAVSGFIGQFAEFSDLSAFLAQFRPGVTSTFAVKTLDGGQNPQAAGQGGIEAVS